MRRIVDQDIDAAHLVDRRRDDPPALRSFLDVGIDKDRSTSFGLDQFSGDIGIFVFAEVRNQHIRALARVGKRNRAPYSAIAAGDDCPLVFQPAGAAIASLTVVRDRLHGARQARRSLLLIGKWRFGEVGHLYLRRVGSRFLSPPNFDLSPLFRL